MKQLEQLFLQKNRRCSVKKNKKAGQTIEIRDHDDVCLGGRAVWKTEVRHCAISVPSYKPSVNSVKSSQVYYLCRQFT